MGKKINNTNKGKKEVKELQPVTRTIKINLHKQLHGEKFKKKAPKAVKVVKELAKKMMFTKDVRVDPELNKQLWSNGVRNVAKRISVIMERKKKEMNEMELERDVAKQERDATIQEFNTATQKLEEAFDTIDSLKKSIALLESELAKSQK